MTVDELLTSPLDSLNDGDRTRLLVALLGKTISRNIRLTGEASDHAVLVLREDDLAPGTRHQVHARNYFGPVQIRDLLVLEPEHEQVDTFHTETVTSHGGVSFVDRRTSHLRRMVRTPAAAWELHEMYAGSRNVLESADARRPLRSASGPPPFQPFEVVPGIDVLVSVSHRLEGPASFRGLLIGKRVTPPPARRARSR